MVGGPRRLEQAGAQSEYNGIERDSWMGIYRALFSQNIPVDFVHADDIGANGVRDYKLLFVPYPLMMSERTARAIARFVDEGGAVMMEARAAWNDERGYATTVIPGFGLGQVFGARESVVTPAQQTTLAMKDGGTLHGAVYQEALEPQAGGRTIATFPDGSAAIVECKHGKGKTVFAGSFLSLAFERTGDPELQRFFQGLLDWAAVDRPVSASEGVEVRWLDGPGYRLVFVLNAGMKEIPAEVRMRTAATSAQDLITGQTIAFQREGDRVVLTKSLASQSAWVLEMR